jgi:hypothetical protein
MKIVRENGRKCVKEEEILSNPIKQRRSGDDKQAIRRASIPAKDLRDTCSRKEKLLTEKNQGLSS